MQILNEILDSTIQDGISIRPDQEAMHINFYRNCLIFGIKEDKLQLTKIEVETEEEEETGLCSSRLSSPKAGMQSVWLRFASWAVVQLIILNYTLTVVVTCSIFTFSVCSCYPQSHLFSVSGLVSYPADKMAENLRKVTKMSVDGRYGGVVAGEMGNV